MTNCPVCGASFDEMTAPGFITCALHRSMVSPARPMASTLKPVGVQPVRYNKPFTRG